MNSNLSPVFTSTKVYLIYSFFYRLIAMKESPAHEKILQELVMDILRVLSSPDYEVRKKTLGLAMDLVTSRNIDELVLVLKKVFF